MSAPRPYATDPFLTRLLSAARSAQDINRSDGIAFFLIREVIAWSVPLAFVIRMRSLGEQPRTIFAPHKIIVLVGGHGLGFV